MDSEPLLSVQALTVVAGERTLLRGVSLALQNHELVGLQGPSGCGKTSLLKTIVGLEDSPEGVVRCEGVAPDVLGWPKFRRRVLYVHQRPVFAEGAVETNLRRPFLYQTCRETYSPKRAGELMEQIGLQPRQLAQHAQSLSEGEQQRVALVRGLLLEPAVLLLDEPTSALDEAAGRAVWELIASEAAARTCAVLVVSHENAGPQTHCHRTVDLRDFSPDAG